MAKKIAQFVFNSLLLLLGSLAIFVLSYQFGWMLLVGRLGWGNDLPFALSLVYYLERWAPYLPRWHYEWGGGMPFLRGYPLLITYLTSFSHRLSGLSIVQTARLFYWLSMPLAGIGIMALARLIFKNWLLATLAGLFFVLSPDAWLWIIFGGFYAATASFPFMVASFVFFELGWQKRRRIWWLLTMAFCGLTWLTHPVTGISLAVGLGVYGLGRGLLERKALLGIIRAILIGLAGILLVAFWTIPFAISRPGGVGVAPHQVVYVTIREILGLVPSSYSSDYITSVFLSGAVWVLAALGVFFSLIRRSKKVWILIACSLIGLFFMIGPGIFPWLLQGFGLTLWSLINVRAVVLLRLFVPIIAAYGAISLGESPFRLIAWFWKRLRKNLPWRLVTQVIGGAIALVVVYLAFKQIIILPANHPPEFFYLGYGPVYHWLDPQEIDGQWMIEGGKRPMFPSVSESLKRLLTLNIQLDDAPIREAVYFPELVKKTGLDSHDRIDVSPLSGSVIASWSTASDVSLIPPYLGNDVSLMRLMIGYQQACFHNFAEDFVCLKEEVKSLAKWWGLKLVYVGFAGAEIRGEEKKLLDNLKLAGFRERKIELESGPVILTYEIPETSGFANLSNKPMVLVIGNNPPHNDGYDTAFRSFNRFGLDYDRAIPVPGKRFIDDYTLSELKKYPLIVLFGYRYHDRNKAWSLLSRYVQEGGSLFVDTGWQYWSQDWGKLDKEGQSLTVVLPELLPVKQAKWGNIGTSWRGLKVNSSQLGREISSQGWADLVWEGNPWGMSLAEPQDLREFARPLVTASGKVIVAGGNFGQGKIVWSGMNLFGHTSYNESDSENDFLLAVFSWLTSLDQSQETDLDFMRITPDKVEVQIYKTLDGERKVMFKEAMGPGWKAYLNLSDGESRELPILKVGPGWKLVLLPEEFSTGTLTFVYGRTARDWVFISISILTGLGMILYWLNGVLKGVISTKFIPIRKTKGFLTKRFYSLKKDWEDEEI